MVTLWVCEYGYICSLSGGYVYEYGYLPILTGFVSVLGMGFCAHLSQSTEQTAKYCTEFNIVLKETEGEWRKAKIPFKLMT